MARAVGAAVAMAVAETVVGATATAAEATAAALVCRLPRTSKEAKVEGAKAMAAAAKAGKLRRTNTGVG